MKWAWLRREWPTVVVLGGVSMSLVVVAANHFRRGSFLLTASVAVGFLLRMVLSSRDAGLLAVRSRFLDLLGLGISTVGLAVLSVWVPSPR
jgi:hypothetical protein